MTKKSIILKVVLLLCMSFTFMSRALAGDGVTTKAYGLSLDANPGIVEFAIDNPKEFKLIYPLEANEIASAGAYVDGRYFAMILKNDQQPLGLFSFNLETGERTLVKDMKNASSFYMDMTYNHKTNTLYALWYDYPSTMLMKIDPITGENSIITTYENKSIFSIAASPEGLLYATSVNGTLYSINETNGDLVELHYLRNYCNNLQSLSFDYNSGRLFWVACPYSVSVFYEIDLDNMTVEAIGEMPDGYKVGGLHLAYTKATEHGPKAVSNLTAQQDDALNPQLEWTNPSNKLNGEQLNSISKIEIYRNHVLASTLSATTPGSKSTWTDTQASNETHQYKVVVYGENNLEGYPAWISCFSGEDVPGATRNVKATKIDQNTATIEWQAPEAGLNNAWFDIESMTYTIVRYPGKTTIVENLTEKNYTDTNVTEYANYTYEVIACSRQGQGGGTRSNSVSLGNGIVPPFVSTFKDEESFKLWEVYNRDDNEACWEWLLSDNGQGSATSESFFTPYTKVDNWLISPPLMLEAGTDYELCFTAYTAYYQEESFRVTMGETNTPEGQNNILVDRKVKNYYGEKINLPIPTVEKDGIYYIAFEHYAEVSNAMMMRLNDVVVRERDKTTISGMVSNANNEALANAEVTLNGKHQYTTRTDKNGHYEIERVSKGDYQLTVDAQGYVQHTEQITLQPDVPFEKNVTMKLRDRYEVSGKVCDIKQNPIDGVRITLSGYEHHQTFTDSEGNYRIADVCQSNEYTLIIEKNEFVTIEEPLDMQGNVVKETVQLTTKNLPPFGITAVTDSIHPEIPATVSWQHPIDMKEYAYDDGKPGNPIGYDVGGEYHIIGSIYREPAQIYRVKWYTLAGNKAGFVHLYIIALDENGEPTGELLFSKKEVPTNDDEWTTYELPTPVNAPNGFVLALSGQGNIMLARDCNTEVISEHTIFYSTDYSIPLCYTYFERNNWPGAILLRAEGERIEQSNYNVPLTYNVWRMKKQDRSNPSNWTVLKENITETQITDDDLANQPQGEYYYAVKAHYKMNDITSKHALSNPIANKRYTMLDMTITTNSEPQDAEGALVVITDSNDNQFQAMVKNGKVNFPQLRKDIYSISIAQEGFETLYEEIDLSDKNQYEFKFTLVQLLARVKNLDLMPAEKPNDFVMMWDQFDNITDDFEDNCYEDFTVNPTGKVGWKYIDNDNLETYGFGATEFPNMRARMAAILFNSTTTDPELAVHTAHSGDRCLAFFAARPTEENGQLVGHESDDYLISPKLNFKKDFTFRFWARSYDDYSGLERIRVGYSTSRDNLASFKWIDAELREVPTEYAEYTYSIPKEAKYVVLNSSSYNGFLLLVDDIFIGTDQIESGETSGKSSFNQYKVYLDNICIATTNETSYRLTGVQAGSHVAAVTKEYKSGESEPLSIEFVVEGGDAIDENTTDLKVYVNAAGELAVEGEYTTLTLFDITGKTVKQVSDPQPVIGLSELNSGIYVVAVQTPYHTTQMYKIQKK